MFNAIICIAFHFQVAAALVAFFTVGLMWGFLETFLFWYLDDLGAGHTLMGLSMVVATLTGLPIQFYATFLIKKVGHEGLAVLALTAMALRCVGYSYLTSPSLFLAYETLKPVRSTIYFAHHKNMYLLGVGNIMRVIRI